jgi:hypothetical protein
VAIPVERDDQTNLLNDAKLLSFCLSIGGSGGNGDDCGDKLRSTKNLHSLFSLSLSKVTLSLSLISELELSE